jgi:hypothetical protein
MSAPHHVSVLHITAMPTGEYALSVAAIMH